MGLLYTLDTLTAHLHMSPVQRPHLTTHCKQSRSIFSTWSVDCSEQLQCYLHTNLLTLPLFPYIYFLESKCFCASNLGSRVQFSIALNLDRPVGQHFNLPNHSISDMTLQGIEPLAHCKDSVWLSREKVWMKRLRTVKPHGLNIHQGND